MPLLLLIFFGFYGWIEFEAFIAIGNTVGGLVTFLGIFVTAFIGITLVKREGTTVMKRWQNSLKNGEAITSPLASSISLMLGAILMLLPGYVTDFIGFLCFIPGIRVLIGQTILSRLGTSVFSSSSASSFYTKFGSTGGFSSYSQTNTEPNRRSNYGHQNTLEGEVIEGQYESKDEPHK